MQHGAHYGLGMQWGWHCTAPLDRDVEFLEGGGSCSGHGGLCPLGSGLCLAHTHRSVCVEGRAVAGMGL